MISAYNPPESVPGLWYDPGINRFIDEGGFIIHDLQPYFDVWELDEWKKTKDYGLLMDRNGNLWEIFYPIEDFNDVICDHECILCKNKCEVYGMLRDYEQEKNYIKSRKEVFQ